ncbi:hypothetical protein QQG55_32920 [Brugia pahangi]
MQNNTIDLAYYWLVSKKDVISYVGCYKIITCQSDYFPVSSALLHFTNLLHARRIRPVKSRFGVTYSIYYCNLFYCE